MPAPADVDRHAVDNEAPSAEQRRRASIATALRRSVGVTPEAAAIEFAEPVPFKKTASLATSSARRIDESPRVASVALHREWLRHTRTSCHWARATPRTVAAAFNAFWMAAASFVLPSHLAPNARTSTRGVVRARQREERERQRDKRAFHSEPPAIGDVSGAPVRRVATSGGTSVSTGG